MIEINLASDLAPDPEPIPEPALEPPLGDSEAGHNKDEVLEALAVLAAGLTQMDRNFSIALQEINNKVEEVTAHVDARLAAIERDQQAATGLTLATTSGLQHAGLEGSIPGEQAVLAGSREFRNINQVVAEIVREEGFDLNVNADDRVVVVGAVTTEQVEARQKTFEAIMERGGAF